MLYFQVLAKKITTSIINTEGLKAIILQTFGAGNAPTDKWFVDELERAIKKGIVVYNVTQCLEGSVIQGKYETSSQLKKIGVISGEDITMEAAITKLMFLLEQKHTAPILKKLLSSNLRGEISVG